MLAYFDKDISNNNYVVVEGKTQAGKTGVLFALVNIINKCKLQGALDDLQKVYYLTGDNSKDLLVQQKERWADAKVCYNDNDIDIEFLKLSDLRNYQAKVNTIANSIIFIDESHYATKKEVHLLQQFLKFYSVDYMRGRNLEGHKIRIISNTATPYAELASDLLNQKGRIELIPGDGYIGIKDFDSTNVRPLEKSIFDKRIVNTKLPEVLDETYDHLQSIYEEKGLVTCAIFRVNGKGNSQTLEKYVEDNFKDKFKIEKFDISKGGCLRYDSLYFKITNYPDNQNEGKYQLILIKNAFRMGISIPNKVKDCISVLYDFASNDENPTVTEQGLLGRMTGYWKEGDTHWRDVRFYINEAHWKSLKERADKETKESSSGSIKMRISIKGIIKLPIDVDNITDDMVSEGEYKEISKVKPDEAEKLLQAGKVYRFDTGNYAEEIDNIKKEEYHVFKATDFFKEKVGTEYFGSKSFQLSDLKIKDRPLKETFIDCLIANNYDIQKEEYKYNGGRKCYPGYCDNYALDMLNDSKKMPTNNDVAYKLTKDDVGKYIWQALLNADGVDKENPEIYIHLKIGRLYAFQLKKDWIEKPIPPVPTYDTSKLD